MSSRMSLSDRFSRTPRCRLSSAMRSISLTIPLLPWTTPRVITSMVGDLLAKAMITTPPSADGVSVGHNHALGRWVGHRLGEAQVVDLVPHLAVPRHEELRPGEVEDELELLLAGVARGVHLISGWV